MKKQALTMTVIFKANSLNYGEGTANVSELKKFHRGNGDVYTFASRQSIRYDMVRLGNEIFDWNLNVVDDQQKVIQFKADCTIKDSVEMDLFGYMKTKAKSGADKRAAVCRLSHAISLEPYRSDLEFLNNMGLASRINKDANLATIEQHESLYTYTLTVDLSRVGIDGEIELDQKEKADRVKQLLEVTKFLNREIRGRQESLSPLFVIGGLYPIANPFFLGRITLEQENPRHLKLDPLKSAVDQNVFGESVREHTAIGVVNGIFENEQEFDSVASVLSIEQFYNQLLDKIDGYYEGQA